MEVTVGATLIGTGASQLLHRSLEERSYAAYQAYLKDKDHVASARPLRLGILSTPGGAGLNLSGSF